MSLGFTNQVFTLAQMDAAVRLALCDGWGIDADDFKIESVATIICAVVDIPKPVVLDTLRSLEEYRKSQRDHP